MLLITGYSGQAEDTHGLSRLAKLFRQADIAAALAELVPAMSWQRLEPAGCGCDFACSGSQAHEVDIPTPPVHAPYADT